MARAPASQHRVETTFTTLSKVAPQGGLRDGLADVSGFCCLLGYCTLTCGSCSLPTKQALLLNKKVKNSHRLRSCTFGPYGGCPLRKIYRPLRWSVYFLRSSLKFKETPTGRLAEWNEVAL